MLMGWIGMLKLFFFGLGQLLSYLAVLLYATFCKIIATAYCLVRYFPSSIGAIPENWVRVCFSIDSTTPLEIVPGVSVFPNALG